ncbi:conserved hypothetical protein [Catenulispora acidiphila DSM 44928]|uniref:DUF3618 domain-containing protein n=1 Tax=Catenulispora acidiphila (strain DSM 44928 / JCM 14897 / NBRC 102108 / NRRL B-24433 / ID139908) TaxID=479433 RepID=C7Q1H4_CATAD|nr:DUF3618 domain-containing protein [Catenulispora acidiphila]ACU73703.1 conserved hypothetical protein [Catenulispora acidiphila DSM 44928]
MSTDPTANPTANGARRPATVEKLREQVAHDRDELAETVTALHAKTDVKGRVREKTAGAEIAAAAIATRAGRAAGSVPRLIRWAAATASGQVHKSAPPAGSSSERPTLSLRDRLRIYFAIVTAILAFMRIRRWRSR